MFGPVDISPRDLRAHDPAAGRLYEPDPAAVANLKRILERRRQAEEERQRSRILAKAKQGRAAKTAPAKERSKLIVQPVVATAVNGQASAPVNGSGPEPKPEPVQKSRAGDVLTREVVTEWYQKWYIGEQRSPAWIAQNNGLITTSGMTIRTYFAKYGLPLLRGPVGRKKGSGKKKDTGKKAEVVRAQTLPEPEALPFVTPPQAAEIAGASDDTIRRWRRAGQLPYTKIGGAGMAIDRADLEAFLAARAAKETAVVEAPALGAPAAVAGDLAEIEAAIARLKQLADVKVTVDLHFRIAREL